jgi:hypothetical protein
LRVRRVNHDANIPMIMLIKIHSCDLLSRKPKTALTPTGFASRVDCYQVGAAPQAVPRPREAQPIGPQAGLAYWFPSQTAPPPQITRNITLLISVLNGGICTVTKPVCAFFGTVAWISVVEMTWN